jgi:hypothetical protein
VVDLKNVEEILGVSLSSWWFKERERRKMYLYISL